MNPGGLGQVEKRLMWGNSPKRISQSVKRVNGRPPHYYHIYINVTDSAWFARTESSIAHGGGRRDRFCRVLEVLRHLQVIRDEKPSFRPNTLSFSMSFFAVTYHDPVRGSIFCLNRNSLLSVVEYRRMDLVRLTC